MATKLKVAFILIVFLLTLLAGIVPIKHKRFRQNQVLLGIANTFSGGVFLAIAFVHIIPETSNTYYLYTLRQLTK
jgi:zinc transporter ZupT